MQLTDTFQSRITDILDNLKLSNTMDNTILKNRFLYEVMLYEKKRDETKSYYDKFRFIVTTGSILLPAILSIGQMDPANLPPNFDTITYWASWIISLSVTVSNGFLQLLSIDKKYFTYSIITEQLKTEGWQYVQLAGKYGKYESHDDAYKSICKSIETIKKKQIEQEFSSGKVDNKKKDKNEVEFNFKKEMDEFKKHAESNSNLVNNNIKDMLNSSKESILNQSVKINIDDTNEPNEENTNEPNKENTNEPNKDNANEPNKDNANEKNSTNTDTKK